jgi:hypothetical protein
MKKIFYFVGILLLFSGCTEEIDFDLNDSQTRIVIDARFTTEEKVHYVYLEQTSSYYDDQQGDEISGATVKMIQGNSTVFLTEESPGVYATDSTFKVDVGKIYTCEVDWDGEVFTAIDTVQPVAVVDGIFAVQLFDTIPIIEEIDSSYSLLIFTQETPGLGDYYLWYYYVNGELLSDTLIEYSFTDDAFVDGAYVGGLPVYNIEQELVGPGDTVVLEQLSISRGHYDMLNSVLIQTVFRGGLFDGPPANVPSNFDNGALGFFVLSDISRAETVVL